MARGDPQLDPQLAPNNYVYTHSLLYSVDPFTDTGILGTVKLNDHWLVSRLSEKADEERGRQEADLLYSGPAAIVRDDLGYRRTDVP